MGSPSSETYQTLRGNADAPRHQVVPSLEGERAKKSIPKSPIGVAGMPLVGPIDFFANHDDGKLSQGVSSWVILHECQVFEMDC